MSVVKKESLLWERAYKDIQNHTFRLQLDKVSGTGFYFANAVRSDGSKEITIGTAFHVVADTLKDTSMRIWTLEGYFDVPYAIWHKDLIVSPDFDLAFFSLPSSSYEYVPDTPVMMYIGTLPVGCEIAWCGYPQICISRLCLFHGYVSTIIQNQNDYLLDGVAINGISGGPAFILQDDDQSPLVCGLITEYRPNKLDENTCLPGLTYLRNINSIYRYMESYNRKTGYDGSHVISNQ